MSDKNAVLFFIIGCPVGNHYAGLPLHYMSTLYEPANH